MATIGSMPLGLCTGHDSVLHKLLVLLTGYSKMVIILQMRFPSSFSCRWDFQTHFIVWKLLSDHKFTLRPCWVITWLEPCCRWRHIPMANTWLTNLAAIFSDNQDTIIHDATRLSSDLNKYFVPRYTKSHCPSFCRNSFSSVKIAVFSLWIHIKAKGNCSFFADEIFKLNFSSLNITVL